MSTVTSYAVVEANTSDEITDKVNACIENGWQPVGAVVVVWSNSARGSGPLFFQTIVKTG